jgi:alpha-mannosidase
MENDHVRVELSREGRLISMLHKRSGRESLAPGEEGNRFVMFDDRPNAFDAWDVDAFHLETRRELSGAIRASVIESGPLRAGVSFEYQFGPTTLKQHVFLQGGAGYLEFDTEVDWQHRRKFLKVEFPVAVRARHAAYEMPFGVAWRPTTFNNSFEMAQFEVPGHRWMDFSEEGFGTALFTDSKYGYACHENVLRLSLLRGPNYPDPAADLGHHRFRYALYPHSGSLVDGAVVRLAHAFNDPLLPVAGEFSVGTLFSVDSPHIIIDTVKQAANSQDVIVRIYECHGARGDVTLQAGFSVQTALRTNLLEEPIEHLSVEGNRMNLAFRPYEILTLRLILARAG